MVKTRFTLEEAEKAGDAWNFNCGPGALCGVLGMTPDEIRPHCGDFEAKGYTNPTLMYEILRNLNVKNCTIYRGDVPVDEWQFPALGLIRVQWDGPWTQPGVPMAARYRQTHWAGCRFVDGKHEAFDINAMCVGGWLDFGEWSKQLLPWLARECVKRSNGEWWPTHVIEVQS